MNCEKFMEYLDNYESLSDKQKLQMTVHANECEACQKELDFMLSIIATTATLPKIEPPDDFMDNLNILIDAEERKKRRVANVIFANVRRNWQQYSAAVACFALVAVITANSNQFIDKMERDNTDTPYTEGYVIPASTDVPETVIVQETVTAPTLVPVKEAEIIQKKTGVVPLEEKSVENTVSEQPKTTEAVEAEAVREEEVIATPQAIQEAEEVTDYGIATASLTHETSPEGYARQRRSMTDITAYDAEEVQENYSLAEKGSIAHSKYIPKETEKPKKAIGQLKISAEDADEAMDVIQLYSYGLSGEMYSTNSASLSMMLSDFNKRGIDYTNYIPSYNGDITFQLVIG